MSQRSLSLAVNGREYQLTSRLKLYQAPGPPPGGGDGAVTSSVAIVGLGYVGLPTAIALHGRCERIIGIDLSQQRLAQIAAGSADLTGPDQVELGAALADGSLELTADPTAVKAADAVIICVPTPVDGQYVPDLAALRGACASVAAHARPGQTVILTSTTYAGTTRELLAEPLRRRGLRVGTDVFVAFCPERIDPGNLDHLQRETPRVVGGITPACTERAAAVIGQLTDAVYLLSSPEAAEATKLYENIFRAVSLALANEFADACGALNLDPVEITLAAGTKPYGFLGALPGPGVGGHCIPCDPHYLLWQLSKQGQRSPLIEQTMKSISERPSRVAERAAEVLAAQGRTLTGAAVIVVGLHAGIWLGSLCCRHANTPVAKAAGVSRFRAFPTARASIHPRIVPNSPCKVASISPRFGPGRSVIFSTSARIASAASLRSSVVLSASVSRSTFFR